MKLFRITEEMDSGASSKRTHSHEPLNSTTAWREKKLVQALKSGPYVSGGFFFKMSVSKDKSQANLG